MQVRHDRGCADLDGCCRRDVVRLVRRGTLLVLMPVGLNMPAVVARAARTRSKSRLPERAGQMEAFRLHTSEDCVRTARPLTYVPRWRVPVAMPHIPVASDCDLRVGFAEPESGQIGNGTVYRGEAVRASSTREVLPNSVQAHELQIPDSHRREGTWVGLRQSLQVVLRHLSQRCALDRLHIQRAP